MTGSKPANPSGHAVPGAPASGTRPAAGFDAQRGNAFQRELDRLSRNDRTKRGDDAAQPAREPSARKQHPEDKKTVGRQQQSGDDRDRYDDVQASFAASGPAAARAGKMAAMAQGAPELPPEHLNRIAAAIQELVAQGGNAQYHLQLPAGSAIISGAVLGQDAGGRLTVQLIANAVLPPAAIQQLQQRLSDRLKDRNLRLAPISTRHGESETRIESSDTLN